MSSPMTKEDATVRTDKVLVDNYILAEAPVGYEVVKLPLSQMHSNVSPGSGDNHNYPTEQVNEGVSAQPLHINFTLSAVSHLFQLQGSGIYSLHRNLLPQYQTLVPMQLAGPLRVYNLLLQRFVLINFLGVVCETIASSCILTSLAATITFKLM